jgi:hypothetical protein
MGEKAESQKANAACINSSKVRLRASGEWRAVVLRSKRTVLPNNNTSIFFIFLMDDDDVKNAGFWDRSL